MGPWRRVAAPLAVAGVLAACTPAGQDLSEEPPPADATSDVDPAPPDVVDERCAVEGDEVARWVHHPRLDDLRAEPVDLRVAVGWLTHGVHEGLHRRGPDGTYRPQLLARVPLREAGADGEVTVRLELRDDLRFSDGQALTGEHVRETYELLVAEGGRGAALLHDPGRYDRIDPDGWEVDGTSVTFTLREDDAALDTWFPRVLPTHVIADVDALTEALRTLVVDGEPVPASGPFLVDAAHEDGFDLRRNDAYHGAHPDRDDLTNREVACLPGIELRFVDRPDEVAATLRRGDADLAWAPGTRDLRDLGATLDVSPAGDPPTEVLVLSVADPHLRDARVREALAAALDRADLVEAVYEPALGELVPADGHDAVLRGADDPDHAGAGAAGLGGGDTSRAEALLAEAGYDLDADGVLSHPERGPLRVALSTTGGDQLRERTQQHLQTAFDALGWALPVDNRSGVAHLDEQVFAPGTLACAAGGDDGTEVTLPGGVAATADCARLAAGLTALWPGPPTVVAERFRPGSGRDPTGLTAGTFAGTLDRCASTLGGGAATSCAVRLERVLVTRELDRDGLVVVPLAPRPHLAIAGADVRRAPVISSAPDAGPLVDAADLVVVRDAP